MAVNTRNKRFSMMSMGRPWMPTLPEPTGDIGDSAAERAQLIFRYASGASSPGGGGGGGWPVDGHFHYAALVSGHARRRRGRR